MVPTLAGGTQDTDFNKGFTKGFLFLIFGEEMGGSGGPSPPYDRLITTICQDSVDGRNFAGKNS